MKLEPWQVESGLLALHNIARGIGDVAFTMFFCLVMWILFSTNKRRVTIVKGDYR